VLLLLPNASLIARKDLRDIFDQLSVTRKSKLTLNSDKSRSAPELFHIPEKRKIGRVTEFDGSFICVSVSEPFGPDLAFISLINESDHCLFTTGLLTRNNSLDFELSQAKYSQKKLFNTLIRNFGYCSNYNPLTAMQISSGNPSMSSNTQVITLDTFKKFLETRQMESKNDCEIKIIIEVNRVIIIEP
jgi:hypothetical protein